MTHDYPLSLALEDFVPTFLALAGFWLLAGLGPHVAWGRAGAVLIGAGGVAKSVWKLLVAGFDTDLPWLEASLFPLMAAGAALLVWTLAGALRGGRPVPWWPFALAYVAAIAGCVAVGSLRPMFFLATTGVTAISVLGAILAGRRRAWGAIALFAVSFALVTALVPLRNHPEHETLTVQWIEQSTNTAAQLALLAAAWLTVRATSSKESP
ncbi:hypothetical protein KZZ52_47075 [Dactylosporangium sp. AC04546]|uniref:hypothetical protein n=1 Tax=Dactylosporangium sp. AC04546 TaxID=2862460 RepID=UPI001EE13E2B|nr:hypothetical protein [Dactylosporangium sp. AC04546]WVK81478.1 hypothetical protein KZZ52_47075 [Dactylosporangium sp. AC04546]